MSPRLNKVNLELTTVCNLACPECAAGINMGLRKHVHHPWEYFVEASKWLYGIHTVVVIGGEPTSHPKFAEFVPKFRELFGCEELILWTNGFKVPQYTDLIKKVFDAVYVSLYDEINAPWNKRPNTDLVTFVKNTFTNSTMELAHTPRSSRGGGGVCERGIHGPIAYADGLIHGCCVSPGLPEGKGIVPSENWRTEVLALELPCKECCFSPQ